MNELDELQKAIWALHHLRNELKEELTAVGEMRATLENTQEYANLRLAEAYADDNKSKIISAEAEVRKLALEQYFATGERDLGGAYITIANVGVIKDEAKALHWAVAKTLYGLLKVDKKSFDLVAKRMVQVDPDLAEFYQLKEEAAASIRKDLKEHLR